MAQSIVVIGYRRGRQPRFFGPRRYGASNSLLLRPAGSGYILRMDTTGAQGEFVETPIVVRYAETDQMGVVYYANYFVWFEVGRNAWCRAKGFSYRDMESNHGRFMTVAEATCRYKAPARYEDDIAVRTRAEAPKDKVVRFSYEIVNRTSGRVLATGGTTHIVTDANMRPAGIPDHFRPLFGLPPR